MRRKSDTLLWGSWLFANKTMMRVKQSCAWLEWRVWELKNRGLSQYPVEVGWVTLGIQIVCARCLANIRVRHSQKQVKNPNTHIYWFKIPRSFNVGGFNMAEEHPYCDFFFLKLKKCLCKASSNISPSPRTTQGLFSVCATVYFPSLPVSKNEK